MGASKESPATLAESQLVSLMVSHVWRNLFTMSRKSSAMRSDLKNTAKDGNCIGVADALSSFFFTLRCRSHKGSRAMKMILAFTLTWVSFYYAVALAAEPGDVVAHWTFNEGEGKTARDVSGSGNHGRIRGARYVRHGDGYALQFDGRGELVDCGTRRDLDPRDTFTLELWLRFSPDVKGHSLQPIAGKDINSFAFIFSPASGSVWFFAPNPAKGSVPINLGHWHHLVGTFDHGKGRMYLDGQEVWFSQLEAERDRIPPNLDTPFTIGSRPARGSAQEGGTRSFKGEIAEVVVYRRALTPEAVDRRFRTTNLTGAPETMAAYVPPLRKIAVDVDPRPLGDLPRGSQLQVDVKQDGRVIARQRDHVLSWSLRCFEFDASELSPGDYVVAAAVLDRNGKRIGDVSRKPVTLATRERFPRRSPHGVRLNNLVTELLNRAPVADSTDTVSFIRDREGWTFLSVELEMDTDDQIELAVRSADGNQETWLTVDDSTHPESWEGEGNTWEVMRRLPAGNYEIVVHRQGGPRIERLIVRAVPHIGWHDIHSVCYNPHEGDRGPEYYAQRVLRNCNFFVTGWHRHVPAAHHAFISRWQTAGRRALADAFLPRPRGKRWTPEQMTIADIVASFKEYRVEQLDGILADELHGRPQYAQVWEDATRAFHQETGQTMHVYTGTAYRYPRHTGFLKAAIESGGRVCWERYIKDEFSTLAAWRHLHLQLAHNMNGWRENMPEVAPHVLANIGVFSQPTLLLHQWPQADFKRHLDLMFNIIVNDKAFDRTAGVMNYKARRMEQELVDWMSMLYRHYCIEGRRDMLSDKPYRLIHIRNPGFVDGLDCWSVNAAEPGSIQAETSSGFAALQGQWPYGPYGDEVALLRRSAKTPNTMTQTVRHLEPGQVYAVTATTADYQDMSQEAIHAFRIDVSGATLMKDHCYSFAFNNMHRVSLKYPKRETAWMNHHRVLFRAAGTEAVLTLCDWAQPEAPGGPNDQELMVSFVEVRPYLEQSLE